MHRRIERRWMRQSNRRRVSNQMFAPPNIKRSHLELACTSVGKVVYTGKAMSELEGLTGSQDSKVGRIVVFNNVVWRANSQYEQIVWVK
jgi:hypothetical protein